MTKIKVGDFIVLGNRPAAYVVDALGPKQAVICGLHAPDGIAGRQSWRVSRTQAANLRQALRFETAQEAWGYVEALHKRFELTELGEAVNAASRRFNLACTEMRDAFLREVAEANEGAKE